MKEEGELKLTTVSTIVTFDSALFNDFSSIITELQDTHIKSRLRFPWKYFPFNFIASKHISLMFARPSMDISPTNPPQVLIKQQIVVVGASYIWARILLKREK